MRKIILELTPDEANKLDIYLIMTTNHRQEELKAWKKLAETDGDRCPAAKSNADFWEDMNNFINKIMEDLRK